LELVWGSWYVYVETLVNLDRDDFGVYELADEAKKHGILWERESENPTA
jgi:hypothetical protein